MSDTKAKALESALRSMVADIEAMKAKKDWFGPFAAWKYHETGSVMIEWPNLASLLAKAKGALR